MLFYVERDNCGIIVLFNIIRVNQHAYGLIKFATHEEYESNSSKVS